MNMQDIFEHMYGIEKTTGWGQLHFRKTKIGLHIATGLLVLPEDAISGETIYPVALEIESKLGETVDTCGMGINQILCEPLWRVPYKSLDKFDTREV